MSDELQKIAWASTEAGSEAGQAREPVLWEDGLLLRIQSHDEATLFDFPSLAYLAQTTAAAEIGVDDSSFTMLAGDDVQELLASIDAALDGFGAVVAGVILADGSVDFTGDQSHGGYGITGIRDAAFVDGSDTLEIDHATGLWSFTSSVAEKFVATSFIFDDGDYANDLTISQSNDITWEISTGTTVSQKFIAKSFIFEDREYSNNLILDKPEAAIWEITAFASLLRLSATDFRFVDYGQSAVLDVANANDTEWSFTTTIAQKFIATSFIFDASTAGLKLQAGLTTVGAVLTLGTKETTVDTSDVLGRINFYAPLEASGTDAILVAASIVAQAEAEFTASANATSLLFQTGASEVATTKMTLTSGGDLIFTTSGSGLPYGSFSGNEIAWEKTSAAQNAWYVITNTIFTSGPLNLATQSDGVLTLEKAGVYSVVYSVSCSSNTINTHVKTGISIDDATPITAGISHFDNLAAGDEVTVGGPALLTVTAGQTLRLKIQHTDAATPTLSVSHISLIAFMVGG